MAVQLNLFQKTPRDVVPEVISLEDLFYEINLKREEYPNYYSVTGKHCNTCKWLKLTNEGWCCFHGLVMLCCNNKYLDGVYAYMKGSNNLGK